MSKKPPTITAKTALAVAAAAGGTMPTRKPLAYVGRAQEDYRALCEGVPDLADEAGRLLLDVQYGDDPTHIEPMPDVGAGVFELKVDLKDGWYRVFYVAKFAEAVYVLHSFQKKTNKTAPKGLEMGAKRYQLLIESRKPRK